MNQSELKVVENGLIPIYENDSKNVVNARELHEFISSAQEFANWIKNRIEKYGFIESEDYLIILSKSTGGRPSTEYILTMEAAKEIAMVENNDRGRQVRRYFIEAEKRFREQSKPKQMTQAEILAGLAQCNVELERKVTAIDTRLSNALAVFTSPSKDDWRHDINTDVNYLVETNGLSHLQFRHELYQELEQTARVNLNSRQSRLKERMKQAGATYKDRQAISKLDVIEREPMLKVVFESIVRKYQAKYAR